MNRMPEVNKDFVGHLIASAKQRIDQYESKIRNIDLALADAEGELETLLAILEYEAKHEEQKDTLRDMFICEGEYGAGTPVAPSILELFRNRRELLVSRIAQLRYAREKRQKGIELVRADIGLLEKILQHRNRSWIHEATVVDM